MTSTLAAPPVPVTAIRLVDPLPGFDAERDWTLSPIDPDGVLFALRSVTDPGLRFVLTPPECFFDGYAPDLGAVASTLGADGDDLDVLLVLTIGDDLARATANLRAPVVVARRAGVAAQVVLDDDTLPLRAPVLGDAAGDTTGGTTDPAPDGADQD